MRVHARPNAAPNYLASSASDMCKASFTAETRDMGACPPVAQLVVCLIAVLLLLLCPRLLQAALLCPRLLQAALPSRRDTAHRWDRLQGALLVQHSASIVTNVVLHASDGQTTCGSSSWAWAAAAHRLLATCSSTCRGGLRARQQQKPLLVEHKRLRCDSTAARRHESKGGQRAPPDLHPPDAPKRLPLLRNRTHLPAMPASGECDCCMNKGLVKWGKQPGC